MKDVNFSGETLNMQVTSSSETLVAFY